MADVKLFAGSGSTVLADKISDYYGYSLGNREVKTFSDGEMQVVINESVRGAYVFFIASTFSPAENLIELLLMIDSAKRASAEYITAVIPYFGYARQDRKDKPRVPMTAKKVANQITETGADRILTMDLHAGQIQGFFDIPVDDLTSRIAFAKDIKKQFYKEGQDVHDVETVFVSPDAGGTVRARRFADMFGGDIAIVDKRRPKAGVSEVMNIIGEVKGCHAILVDDIVDSGGTLCNAAKAIMDAGALSVRAYITHGVLTGKACQKVEDSVLEELVITDSIKFNCPAGHKKTRAVSVSTMFGEAIRRVSNEESVSSLFAHKI